MGDREPFQAVIVVADAGPILHLHWIGCSSWCLPQQTILIVGQVWREIECHAPDALADARFVQVSPPSIYPFEHRRFALEDGEAAAIALALTRPGALLLTDDEAARRACMELGLAAVGTIGLILEACRAGRVGIAEATRALEALPTRGRLHVAPKLLARAIAALQGD